ncbi:MAG: HIT domain-containing protein [archaeon]
MGDDCIFCKIVKGELPSKKILENEGFIVIMDANPKSKGHCLVVPKVHYETFLDMPAEKYESFLRTARMAVVIILKEVRGEGFNFLLNNYGAAGQDVPHVHMHIIPRKRSDKVKLWDF